MACLAAKRERCRKGGCGLHRLPAWPLVLDRDKAVRGFRLVRFYLRTRAIILTKYREKMAEAGGSERTGFAIIVTSLVVICFTSALWFTYKQSLEESRLRDQGARLSKIISALPYNLVIDENNAGRFAHVVQVSTRDPELAYLAVFGERAKVLAEFNPQSLVLPDTGAGNAAGGLFGERQVTVGEQVAWEYFAPLLKDGNVIGQIRLGYLAPQWGPSLSQVPQMGLVALAIFLLAALFYFFLRRELAPLAMISRQLDSMRKVAASPQAGAGADLERPAQVERMVVDIQQRMLELEGDRDDLSTNFKVIEYQRRQLRSIIESLPVGVVVLDQTGVVAIANPRLQQLLGVDPNDILGKRPGEWLVDELPLSVLSKPRTGKTLSAVPVEFSPERDPGKNIAMTVWPIQSADKSVISTDALVIFQDVTAEKILRDSSSEFIAHVAHELKSPLNVLSMYAEMLRGPDAQDEALRIEATNVIGDEVERLSLLISNILNISKIETGSIHLKRTRVKIVELAQDALESCARSAKDKGLTLTFDAPNEISPVAVDKALMRIAINNLLTNAIKYSDPEGTVRVLISETEEKVEIAVEDEGIGISAEDQQRVFDKFVRSEDPAVSQRSGHGLGLSLAREVVQLHQGTLSLTSEVGKGSVFTIELDKHSELLKQAI